MSEPSKKQYSTLVAISFILVSLVFGAFQSGAIRYMTKQMTMPEALFLSNISFFIVVFISNLISSKDKLFKNKILVPVKQKKLMLIRCIFGLTGMGLYVLSLKYLSLLIFSAFALIPNLIVAMIGILYFKEPVTRQSVIGLMIGSVGILSLSYASLKYVQAEQVIYLLIPCAFVCCMVGVILFLRSLVKTESVTTITYYHSIGLLTSALCLIPLIDEWHDINKYDIIIALCIVGGGLTISQNFRSLALKYNSLTVYAAFMPLSLIISSLLDYIMYGGVPATRTIIASVLILLSSFLVARGKDKIKSNLN